MQDLTIALAQFDQIWEDKKNNLKQLDDLLRNLPQNTDLLLLPEMFHTAFTMNGEVLAETMEDSLALNWLKQLAKEKNTAIYTSFIARDSGLLYNRGVFVEPDGNFHLYDKRKTFGLAGENEVYASGNKEQIVTWKGWKINLQICYDLRFPENIRNGISDDGNPRYDLLLYVANWPERRALHWKTLLQARAIENQCFVAGLNRVGTDANGLTYSGDSNVYSALGEPLIPSKPGYTGLLFATLSYTALNETRLKLPFLLDSSYRSFNS